MQPAGESPARELIKRMIKYADGTGVKDNELVRVSIEMRNMYTVTMTLKEFKELFHSIRDGGNG